MEKLSSEESSASKFPQADKLLSELVSGQDIPGLGICFLRDGTSLWSGGYGYSDIEQMTQVDPEKTLFRAASASKPIAATALAKLVTDGAIDLDASFYDYVPYFPEKEYDFTIRQLASHTAGIRGYRGKEFALNLPFGIKASLEIFQDDPLLFKPGTSYLYNSYDWVLLSLAIQEASGIPFEDYVYNNILKPLGMVNTIPEIPGDPVADKAEFYTKTSRGFRKAVEVDNRYKLAGGGYLITARDLLKLGQSHLENSLLDPEIAKEFLTAQQINNKSTYYGLGWEVSTDKQGRPFYGHTGNSVGGYSNFFVYPNQNAVVAILINSTDPKVQPELDHLIDILFGIGAVV